MKIIIDKNFVLRNMFLFLFLFVMLVPGFRNADEGGGGVEVLAILIFIFLSLLVLGFYKFPFSSLKGPFIFAVFFQILLAVVALINREGDSGLGYLFLAVRPLFLFTIAFLFFLYFVNFKDPDGAVVSCLLLLTLLMAFWNFLQLINFGWFDEVNKLLYKREGFVWERTYISFFVTTYFAGYISYVICCVFFSLSVVRKNSLYVVAFLISSVCLVMAQSKAMYVSLMIMPFLVLFFSANKIPLKVFIVLLLMISFLFVLAFKADILAFIAGYNEFIIANSAHRLLADPESSMTLNYRLEQVFLAFSLMAENITLIGSGLGRELYLESWVAAYVYRYGLYGLFGFFVISCYVFYINIGLYKMLLSKGYKDKTAGLVLGVAVWGVTLPITQISSPMIDTGKTAFISMMLIGFTFYNHYRLMSFRKSHYFSCLSHS